MTTHTRSFCLWMTIWALLLASSYASGTEATAYKAPYHKKLDPRVFQITNASFLRDLGYTGKGVNLGLVDVSGVNYRHSTLESQAWLDGGGFLLGNRLAPMILESSETYTYVAQIIVNVRRE